MIKLNHDKISDNDVINNIRDLIRDSRDNGKIGTREEKLDMNKEFNEYETDNRKVAFRAGKRLYWTFFLLSCGFITAGVIPSGDGRVLPDEALGALFTGLYITTAIMLAMIMGFAFKNKGGFFPRLFGIGG